MSSPYIPRLLEQEVASKIGNNKVLLLLGARQVGKTTLIKHLFKQYEGTMLNMDLDFDRHRLNAASKLNASDAMKKMGAGQILVIDEAHRVPEIGRIAKGWYDSGVKTKIILLGSSSTTLLYLAAGELTGRNEKIYLTPLLFKEILDEQEWFYSDRPAAEIHSSFPEQMQSLLLDRLVLGSYPEAFLSTDVESYLTNLCNDYLLKDMFTLSQVRSPEDVRRLLIELALNIGQTISANQLATRLRLSRQTIERYLDLLSGIFVIFSLPSYYTDNVREISRGRKYYFWDTGVKNALQREFILAPQRQDINLLFENWVLAEIMKQSKTFNRLEDFFFWQSRNGSNVELIVKQGSTLHPFNIKFHPHAAKPSRAFTNAYGQEPKIIHPGNILEYLL